MANIGSAFLGDLQAKRIRQLSSGSSAPTSPPSSPPASANNPMSISQSRSPQPPQPQSPSRSQRDEQLRQAWVALAQPPTKAIVDPVLALELRVRWLEVLVLGLAGPASTQSSSVPSNVATTADGKFRTGGEKPQKGRSNMKSLRGKRSDKQKEREQERRKGRESAATLARLTEDVKKRLDAIVETNEGLRKFAETCAHPSSPGASVYSECPCVVF